MEKSNFDRLLQRYLTGDVSEQERIKIEAWLDVMKAEGHDSDLVLKKEDEEKLFRKITGPAGNTDEIKSFRPEGYREKNIFLHTGFRIAASVLLLLTVSVMIWYFSRSDMQRLSTGDVREKIILNDGTIVWLNPHSTLTYYEKPGTDVRQATLSGEALFEVAKDPGRPFTIACGTITVRVTGTSFNLRSGVDQVALQVLTGKVNLSSGADKEGVNVSPHENVIYAHSGKVEKLAFDSPAVDKIIAGTGYDMRFDATALESVFRKIETKFDVTITVEDARMNDCRITADFTDRSLQDTFAMIAELLDIHYSIKDGTVSVSGKGCL